MRSVMSVDDFIMHYASKYYDPVKAREYYLKNRELKGLSNAAPAPPKKVTEKSQAAAAKRDSNQRQREAQTYSKKQIADERTGASNAQTAAHQARMEKLTATATAVRERVVAKLQAAVEKAKAELAGVKLNEIPENATPKVKAFLMRQNASLMNTVQTKVKKELDTASDTAKAEIKKIGEGTRTAINTARTEYTAGRKALTEKYKQISVREEQNIKSQVK